MDFIISFFPVTLSVLFNLISVVISIYLIIGIDWSKKRVSGILNIWFVAVFSISLIWMMRASLESGLNIHLSGAMLLTLMFGLRLGLLGMTLICVLVSFWGNSLPENLGFYITIHAYVSVSLSYLIFLIIEAYLSRNLYIFLFITSFFGSAIVYAMTGFVTVMILALFNAFPLSMLLHEYMPYYLLTSFAEAFITCGLMTLLVVYKPEWVFCFRDERYLKNK